MSIADRLSSLSPQKRELLELLRRKSAAARTAVPAGLPPIPRRPPGESWPLALDQERLWFLFRLDPSDASYNLPTFTRLGGRLNVGALGRALEAIVHRHEAWRTRFPEVDGRPVQVVEPPAPVLLPVVDLSGLPTPAMERETERRRLAVSASAFDLTEGPLLRLLLLRLGPELYELAVVVHHIVTDWFSFIVFWGELETLYVAALEGRPAALPELAVQYADFAVWQREQLGGAALAPHLAYWKEHLKDAPPALELPTDRPRPTHATTRGHRIPLVLSRTASEALKALAQRERATPFMLMLALFQTLLSRWSGQDRVLVAAPNANRHREELQQLLGFFLTQLVFATDLGGDPAFRELLGRVRQVALAAYAHQDLPFGLLVEALQPERDTSRPPIAQVDLLVLGGGAEGAPFGGLTTASIDVDAGTAAFELTLALWDLPAGFSGYLEHNADLFDPTTGGRLAAGFLALAHAVLAQVERPLSALPVASEAAAHQVRCEWNDTRISGVGGTPGGFLHTRFFARAAENPVALAVIDGPHRHTYGELAARATALAEQLRALGIGPEDRVAVCRPRSVELVVALLGVLAAGAAYVPLEPAWPRERREGIVADAGAVVVLGEGGKDLQDNQDDRDRRDPSLLSLATLSSLASPQNLAYLIYTSGSTGRPKAVGITHRNAAAFVSWAVEAFPELGGGVLASTSVGFDLSIFEIFGTLSAGGTVILAENALALPELPAAGEVGLLNTVPSALAELLRLGGLPVSVRTVNLAGEALPRRLAEELLRRHPGVRLLNLYGPSEDTTYSTWAAVPSDALEPAIGRPVAGTRVHLLDRALRPVPLGGRGELCLAGDGLARGYLSRPELTAERFLPDPFAEQPGERIYRTGDLARWRAHGELAYLGRADRQVKVRGFRVEPGEIEALLAGHPEVRDAAVAVRDGRLAAWIVPREGAAPDLRAYLLERLPRHMVPTLWSTLAALPLTANGKVDHRALPSPDAPTAGDGAPRNAVEERLAAVWAEVLGLPRVGVHDNFFRLGGDSILSIRVVAKARQAGLLLTPRLLFERQTVADLAAAVTVEDAPPAEEDDEPAPGEAPLTPIQHWFFAGEPVDPHHFNQAVLLEIRGALDDGWLRRAVAGLQEHHRVLRRGALRDLVTHICLSGLPGTLHRPALEAAAEQVQTSLDLTTGPLLRAARFDLGAGRAGRLLLVLHHLVVDGVSWRILLEDLETFPDVPPKTTSWRRWAERLAAHALSEETAAEADFWLGQPEPEPLPVDLAPAGAAEDTEATAGAVSVALSPESTRALLREASAAYRTRPDDLLLAAVVHAFAPWTGSPRLVLHFEGHGREELFPGVDLSRTVGWFTTLTPVALDLAGADDPGAAIRRVKEALRAIPRRGLGYGLLRRLGDPAIQERLAARQEPEVVFNYLGQLDLVLPEGSRFAPAAESSGTPRSPRMRRRHRIEINAGVVDGRLQAHWSHGRTVHARATIEALAARFLAALDELIDHCTTPGAGGWTPSDFPLARIGQQALDRLTAGDPAIEDLYALSPMQAGLLFHGLYAPATEIYFEQMTCTLTGDLDAAAFRRAWQRLVDRHTILRTAFAWEGLDEPLQVVRQGVQIPWVEQDWRADPDPDARLAAFAAADRRQPFDLRRAPLLRAALLRTGEREHRFVWSFHHLLLDGWSLPPLFAEVFALYEAERTKHRTDPTDPSDSLPPPRLPYRDFVAWLARRDRAADERYWRSALAGVTGATPLPWDTAAPPPTRAEELTRHEAALPAASTAALDALARQSGLTLNTLLQGAWGLLLARWSGRREVLFGAVAAGRPPELPGFDTALGLFINTLPVRLDAAPTRPLTAWLQALQSAQIEARQHEQTPLAEVQRWSGAGGREPLFASLLVFENYPLDAALAEGSRALTLSAVKALESTHYPLSLAVVPDRRLRLRLTQDRHLEPVTGHRLLTWLERLLEAFTAAPDQPLDRFELLSPAERHQLLVEWNDTAAPPFPEERLDRLFAAQAARTPQAPAVRFRGEVLTFHAMEERVERLAERLRTEGVGPDVPVVLLLERSLDLPVAAFAVLAAGGAFVPLDPKAPAERLAAQIASCGAPVIVDRAWLARQGPTGTPGSPLRAAGSPDDLAYIIFTSGSTGTPKGTLIRHRSAANLVLALQRSVYAGAPPGLRVALNASMAFDGAIKQLVQIAAGHCLDLLPEDVRLDPARLPLYLEAHTVDALDVTPSQLRLLRAEAPAHRAPGRVLVGGEALDAALWEALAAEGRTAFWNVYGPTECTVDTTAARVEPGSPHVGRPLANITVHLLDPEGRPVPQGAVGQVHVGGVSLARGYLGRPELTAAVFGPDPFSGASGRLYATGDLGRFRRDGRLELLGRADRQVKIRGFRIEPGEIEAVLRRHPGIRDAAVVPGDGPEPHLTAWIEGTVDRALLRPWLLTRLPEPMVPSEIAVLDALPRTLSGKIDRQALAARAPAAAGRPFEPPAGAVEEKLADLWRELLRADRVGRGDNFFDLGGHSLLATQLMVRVRDHFAVEITLPAIFEAADLAALAAEIRDLRPEVDDPDDLEQLMAELDGFSADQLDELLAELPHDEDTP